MERDPVCGMTVDPARAKSRVEFANDTYVFCSESCAKKFSAEPSKVLEFGAKGRPQQRTLRLPFDLGTLIDRQLPPCNQKSH